MTEDQNTHDTEHDDTTEDTQESTEDTTTTDTHPAVADAKKYRKRAQDAEKQLDTTQALLDGLRKQVALERANNDTGLNITPAALWGVTTINDLLNDDGHLDDEKISAAVTTAREQFGIERTARAPRPVPEEGRVHEVRATNWTDALRHG